MRKSKNKKEKEEEVLEESPIMCYNCEGYKHQILRIIKTNKKFILNLVCMTCGLSQALNLGETEGIEEPKPQLKKSRPEYIS